MGQTENLSTVQAIYEAFGRGDVDWSADSVAAMAAWHGQRTSKADVARFFGEIAGSLEVTEFTPLAMGTSENEVFAFIRFGFRSPTTGRERTTNLHHYSRFRDGKIECYRGSEDTALTAEVLGLEVAGAV